MSEQPSSTTTPTQATKYSPPPALVEKAKELLANASQENLRGAAALWEAHREFLGGVSSAGGAQLPNWEGCLPVPKAAHLIMFLKTREFVTASQE
jgi:hypothetical protein